MASFKMITESSLSTRLTGHQSPFLFLPSSLSGWPVLELVAPAMASEGSEPIGTSILHDCRRGASSLRRGIHHSDGGVAFTQADLDQTIIAFTMEHQSMNQSIIQGKSPKLVTM